MAGSNPDKLYSGSFLNFHKKETGARNIFRFALFNNYWDADQESELLDAAICFLP